MSVLELKYLWFPSGSPDKTKLLDFQTKTFKISPNLDKTAEPASWSRLLTQPLAALISDPVSPAHPATGWLTGSDRQPMARANGLGNWTTAQLIGQLYEGRKDTHH